MPRLLPSRSCFTDDGEGGDLTAAAGRIKAAEAGEGGAATAAACVRAATAAAEAAGAWAGGGEWTDEDADRDGSELTEARCAVAMAALTRPPCWLTPCREAAAVTARTAR